jgi:hypothetical protein
LQLTNQHIGLNQSIRKYEKILKNPSSLPQRVVNETKREPMTRGNNKQPSVQQPKKPESKRANIGDALVEEEENDPLDFIFNRERTSPAKLTASSAAVAISTTAQQLQTTTNLPQLQSQAQPLSSLLGNLEFSQPTQLPNAVNFPTQHQQQSVPLVLSPFPLVQPQQPQLEQQSPSIQSPSPLFQPMHPSFLAPNAIHPNTTANLLQSTNAFTLLTPSSFQPTIEVVNQSNVLFPSELTQQQSMQQFSSQFSNQFSQQQQQQQQQQQMQPQLTPTLAGQQSFQQLF